MEKDPGAVERLICAIFSGDRDDEVERNSAVPSRVLPLMKKSTPSNVGTYVVSRASLPDRVAAWRRLRDVDGYKITSTWIDEAGPGESRDLPDLWIRIDNEIRRSERLVLYVEMEDFPLKGALVEVGIAIAHQVPIRVVAPGVVLDPVSMRPLGSWIRHPLVTFASSIEEAMSGATFDM